MNAESQLNIPGYRELLQQRKAIEEQIERMKREERAKAIQEMKKWIEEFEIRPDDLFPDARFAKKRKRPPVLPKYADPETGKTWSGRGKPPAWLVGDREKYRIDSGGEKKQQGLDLAQSA